MGTFEYLKDQDSKQQVRNYLKETGDLVLLGQYDASSFNETDLATGSDHG